MQKSALQKLFFFGRKIDFRVHFMSILIEYYPESEYFKS